MFSKQLVSKSIIGFIMRSIICVFVGLCLMNIVSGQIISSKSCEELGLIPMQNFRKASQMGLWYLHEFNPWVDNASCYTSLYVSTGSKTAVTTDTYHILHLQSPTKTVGVSTYPEPGVGFYTYKSTDDYNYDVKVTILSTDYYHYTVECMCADAGDHSESYFFVMTRSHTVTPDIQQKIDKVLDDNHVDKTKLVMINQDTKSCIVGLGQVVGGLLQSLLSRILG